jgi:hypothetical protein
MKRKKQSPIKTPPARQPGQSSQERWEDLMFEKVTIPVIIAAMLALFAGLEWWYHLEPEIRSPYPATLLAVAYVSYNFWGAFPELNQLSQATEGEKYVGQLLDRMREQGYRVFHDLQGGDISVDHVIVGTAGIFIIKTHALSNRAGNKLKFDGELIFTNGKLLKQTPVVQAKSQASWLKAALKLNVGKEFDVWPVVLFPGWNIEQPASAFRETWVLEPKALSAFLAGKPQVLTLDEVKIISGQISLFIRAQEAFSRI